MYALRLLGSAVLDGPDGPLSGYAAQPRQIALLALLGAAGDAGLSRDRLLACLWPEASLAAARHGLADAVYRLRKTLGKDTILGHSTTLRLNLRTVRCDVVDFEVALQAGNSEAAATFYRGAFLDGFHLRNSNEFERWKDAEARRLADRAQTALTDLADRALAEGDSDESADWLRQLLVLDPYNSRTVMRLMTALATTGDPANAVKLAAEHSAFLVEELGVEPPAELLALAGRLHSGMTGALREATATALPFEVPREATQSPPDVTFVGRAIELARLASLLDGALAGNGRVVFISGEAGTGKTALAAEFCRTSTERVPDLIVAGGNGNAHTGSGDPFLPFREVLDLLAGGVEARYQAGSLALEPAARLWALLPLTAHTLSESAPDLIDMFLSSRELRARLHLSTAGPDWPNRFGPLRPSMAAAARKVAPQAALFDQYVRLMTTLSKEKPLLLVLDDLQWADSASVGLLFQLARKLPGNRILVLGLFRPSDIAVGRDGGRHPIEPVINELARIYGDIDIRLEEEGDRAFVEALVDAVPNVLDATFREALFRQTRGHALFTVELLRAMREEGMLVRERGRWRTTESLDWSLVPPRMQAVLRERIGRLSEPLTRALSVASVEGETFALEVVADVLGVPVESLLSQVSSVLERQLRIVRVQGIRSLNGQRLSEFRFRHILFQGYLYERLDAVERAYLHERVAEAWETRLGEARTEAAVRLGRHFREAGLADRAAAYLALAGNRADQAGAFPEAVAHFESALEQLLTLPTGEPRDRRELEIQAGLGLARVFSAAPDQITPLVRARALAEGLSDDRLLFRAVTGLYIARAHYPSDNRMGRELALEALSIAKRIGDDVLLARAHLNVGLNAGMRGNFRTQLTSFQQVERLYDPAHPVPWLDPFLEPGPTAQCLIGEALCMLGFPDQARARTAKGVQLSGKPLSPGTSLLMRWYEVMVLLWRRDYGELAERSRAMAEAVDEGGLDAHYGPLARIPLGWSLAHLGRTDEGIAILGKALTEWTATGWAGGACYFTALYAQALLLGGRAEEGLDRLQECIGTSTARDEGWQEPEIRRIRGDLRLGLPHPDAEAAEAAYRSAIGLAREQDAKWPELRATVSLARLLLAQGRGDEVRSMLAGIHGGFAEGFDTVDMQEAKALLAEPG